MNELRDTYFNALALSADDESKREKALTRAYALRTFEIEHYWKRATYFWGFQIAIFAAFGLLWKDSAANPWNPVAIALSGLGVLTAVANSLAAKGSRFWQRNWELHIDMLEDEIEGRLYKTVWMPEGKPSFSVSRVNLALSYCFIGFWIFVTCYTVYRWLLGRLYDHLHWWLLAAVILVAACIAGNVLLRSSLSGTRPNRDGSHNPSRDVERFSRRARSEKLMRRYSPDDIPAA